MVQSSLCLLISLLSVFIIESNDLLEVVGGEVLHSLGSVAILIDGAPEVGMVAQPWQFLSRHAVELVEQLGIAHHGQRLTQGVALQGEPHLSQLAVEPLHGYLGDALQDVVHAVGHAARLVWHEWLINHHEPEALVPRLLEHEDGLRHVGTTAWVGNVEGFLPVGLQSHHVDDLLHFGVHRVVVLGTLDEGIHEHLQQVVGIGAMLESFGQYVQQVVGVAAHLHAERGVTAFLYLFLIAHCLIVWLVSDVG